MIINGAITIIYKGRSQSRIIRTLGRSEKTSMGGCNIATGRIERQECK